MTSIENKVHYCCVSKGNRILYAYNGGGDTEIEKMAALCLERSPPFHTWYFQTTGKKTFGFLMDDGYVYFAIVDEGVGNFGILQFLEHIRFEFKKVSKHTRNGSKGSLSGMSSLGVLEDLIPVVKRLISSLEHVSQADGEWEDGGISESHHPRPSPSPESGVNGQIEVASSTKAPLLGKPGKHDKKKMKDRIVEISGAEDHRRSTDRGVKIDMASSESNSQSPMASAMSLQKASSSGRIRTSPQYARRMWWRKVRIVLAIDVIVCLVLFAIWLGVCHGFRCIS